MAGKMLSTEPAVDPTASVRNCQLGAYTEVGARTILLEVTMADYSYVIVPHKTIIGEAALMGLGAMTHSFDMSQRYLELTINSRTTGSVFVRPPKDHTIAPPGYYTLWISVGTDINEIPSQWGELIKLQ